MNRQGTKAFHVLVAVAAILALGLFAQNAQAVDLTISSETVTVGLEFDAKVLIANATDLYGCGLDLVYDTGVLEVVDADDVTAGVQPSITEGTIMDEGGMSFTILLSALEDGVAGRLVVGIARRGAVDGLDISSEGILMTIRMKALVAGVTALTMENMVAQDSTESTMAITDFPGADVTVTSNHAPVLAAIGDREVAELSTLSFSISATDEDADGIDYGAAPLPAGATFDVVTGAFSWTPSIEDSGTYDVEFSATDDGTPSMTDSETVTITVTDVSNTTPELDAIGDRTVNEGQNLTFTVGATDADDDVLAFSAADLPAGATFDSVTRVFDWTPGSSGSGAYDVTFTVVDDGVPPAQDSETMTITVVDVPNAAPVMDAIGDRAVDEGQNLSFTISATDEEGHSLTFSATGLPAGANFDPATRAFSWTPDFDASGTYDVTFTVVDDGVPQGQDFEIVTITVGQVNRAPELGAIGGRTVDENAELAFTITATDPDDDTFVFSATSLPENATLDVLTGDFSWTPNYQEAGTYNVTFTVTDTGVPSLSDSEAVTITVADAGDLVSVLGTIVDVNGDVVADAVVVVVSGDTTYVRCTDLDGRYEFDDIEPILYALSVYAPGFEVGHEALDATAFVGDTTRDDFVLIEAASAGLAGLVTHAASDAQLGGIRVEAYNGVVDPANLMGIAFTSATGAYEFPGIDPTAQGGIVLRFQSEGFTQTDTTDTTIALAPDQVLVGRIFGNVTVEGDATAIADARIMVRTEGSNISFTAVSDSAAKAEGDYSVSLLADGTYIIRATAFGVTGATLDATVAGGSEEQVDIALVKLAGEGEGEGEGEGGGGGGGGCASQNGVSGTGTMLTILGLLLILWTARRRRNS